MSLRPHVTKLGQLEQVDVSGVADGDVLVWDAATSTWLVAEQSGGAASGERLVQDGVSPPVDLTNEAETDYLYEDV